MPVAIVLPNVRCGQRSRVESRLARQRTPGASFHRSRRAQRPQAAESKRFTAMALSQVGPSTPAPDHVRGRLFGLRSELAPDSIRGERCGTTRAVRNHATMRRIRRFPPPNTTPPTPFALSAAAAGRGVEALRGHGVIASRPFDSGPGSRPGQALRPALRANGQGVFGLRSELAPDSIRGRKAWNDANATQSRKPRRRLTPPASPAPPPRSRPNSRASCSCSRRPAPNRSAARGSR